MSNPYKKMFVLPEEYLRLKQKMVAAVDPAAIVQPQTVPHFVCKICSKIYKQNQDLKRHVKLVHVAPPTQVNIPINKKEEKVVSAIIKKKKKKKRLATAAVFDKVRKWMTIHD